MNIKVAAFTVSDKSSNRCFLASPSYEGHLRLIFGTRREKTSVSVVFGQ